MIDIITQGYINSAKNIPGNVLLYKIKDNIEEVEVLYFSYCLNELLGLTKQEIEREVEQKTILKNLLINSDVDPSKLYKNAFFANEEQHLFHYKMNSSSYIWIKLISKTIDYIDGYDVILTLLYDVSKDSIGYESLLNSKDEMSVVFSNDNHKILYFDKSILLDYELEYEVDNLEIYKLFRCNTYEEFEKEYLLNSNFIKYKNKFLQLKFDEINWRSISSTVLIIKNVTDIVLEAKKNEDTYRKQIGSFMYSSSKTIFIGAIDIDDGTVLSFSSNIFKDKPHDANDFLNTIKRSIVLSKYNEKFVNYCHFDYIREKYNNGEHSLVFPVIKRDNNSWMFLNIILNIVKNPLDSHVEVYMLEEDVTSEKMSSYINKEMIEDRFLGIGLISVPLERIFFYKSSSEIENKYNEYSYDEGMRIIAQSIIEKDKIDLFLENTKLSNIVNRIESLDGKYNLITKIKKSDYIHSIGYIKISYFYADEENGLILYTVEDYSKEIELDPITNHINRTGFLKQCNHFLNQNMINRTDYAMLYFNISGFKAINKNYGHYQGDDLLRHVFIELSNSLLEPIIISRYEADNYALLCRKDKINLDYISELTKLNEFKEFGDIRLKCGIYYVTEDKSISISSMCDRAKLASDDYGFGNVDNVVIYDDKMVNEYMNANDILADLNDAFDNNEFIIYYQPVVDSLTHKITSAEALVRWKKKDGTIISPGRFIPVLEESGDISKIDSFVINHIISFINRRKNEGKRVVPISINMSRKDFTNSELIDNYTEKLNNELSQDLLRIEITESDYADIQIKGRIFLSYIKNTGGNILLDDFGAGLSSFSTLRDYDFDYIKLDMGFVQKIGDSTKNDKIITSVIEMAKKLGLKVIAEGVETREQVDFLTNNNCDYFQGYYFYRPITEEEFENLIN